MKRYIFSGIENFRELGGISFAKNQFTLENKAYRSGMMYEYNQEDAEILESLSIKTIIDLRAPKEVVKNPNVYREAVSHYYNVNISGGSDAGRSSELAKHAKDNPYFMANRYLEYIENKEEIKKFFVYFLQHIEDPIVFHCSAGKDRTGVMSYLLLTLAGVPIKDIIADYQISYTYIQDNDFIIDEDKALNIYISYPQIMENFHDSFQKRYGDTRNYFSQLGFSPNDIQKLEMFLKQ